MFYINYFILIKYSNILKYYKYCIKILSFPNKLVLVLQRSTQIKRLRGELPHLFGMQAKSICGIPLETLIKFTL